MELKQFVSFDTYLKTEMLWNSGERDGRNIGSAYNCFSSSCEFDSFSEIYTVYIPEVGRRKQ